ncbi:hypothetical protein V2A60_000988 [Cordyceps javanica]
MSPLETSPPLARITQHPAAGSRRYRSKAQRPCDLCRARKALCNIPDPEKPCQLCDRTGRPCTFVTGTRSRPTRSSPGHHSADGADGFGDQRQYTTSIPYNTQHASGGDPPGLSPAFEPQIGDMMPSQWPPDLEQLERNEVFMQDIPSFWPLSYDDTSVVDTTENAEPSLGPDASSRPELQATLDRHDRSTSFIGYSNESDPFLLEHYPYNTADELDFFMVTYRRPSLQPVSAGYPPIHFLQSKPQAPLQNQEAMSGCIALKNEQDLLNALVSFDMGVALLRL